MNKPFVFLCLALPLLVGCASNRIKEPVPLSPQELQTFFGRAQDARRFWITTYETERGPRFTGAHRLHEQKRVELPYVSAKNSTLPIIPIRLRTSRSIDALIDTASRANWMSYELSAAVGNIPIGPPAYRLFPVHIVSSTPGYLTVAPRLLLNELQVDTALFYVPAAHGPLSAFWRQENKLDVAVVLGNEFLRAFYCVQLDGPGRVARFTTTTSYDPPKSRLITSVPMREANGVVAVDGFIDGNPTQFLLDTVGDFSVATETATGAPAEQVMIGGLVLRQTPMVPIAPLNLGMPEFARIGRTILSGLIVTLDYQQKLVHFERPME